MNQQSRRSGKSGSLACLLLLSAGLAALPATALAQTVERLVTIEGLDDDDLRAEMRDLSALADASRKTSSYAAINRTANEDTSRMTEALHSLGYYAATVTPLVERHRDGADITFRIERGPLFTIADYKIVYTDDIAADRPDGFAGIGIETTGNPDGAVLSAIEASFITWLQRNGFPGASVPDYHVEADFGTGTATAIFETTTGPVARFGKPVVTSADRTKPSFIAAYADWEQGALYDRSEIIDYREKLSETGLFSEITVDAAPPDEDGIADILVSVSDRDRHTLGAGVSYATDIGPGISLYWEDRNMRGRGEDLALVLDLSGLEQELSADFSRPLPTFPGGFDASGSIKNEITDAYDAKSAELASALNHTWFDEKLTVSGGLTLTYSEIDDPLFGSETEPGTETFNYVKFPLTVAWDSSDDLLDPTTGFRLTGSVIPYAGDLDFQRVILTGATRHAFGETNRVIAAIRAKYGTSIGVNSFDIPATERFYAGGGGSVRGYAYQKAGPIDEGGTPLGGISIVEVNTELRVRVREKIQVAGFVDGGNVYGNYPDFSDALLWGAGAGVRYLTPIGPIRADLAAPLNRRPDDDPVIFYVALGQPF